ncbi:MAG: EscU/YscU/HrcU family type III secretion system export apparatus switch protein [Oscillospiraceae bacterium]|nr:EscU/YscU/HrcU family type III secretion system export apparatus switch protein [Oscillospiraceae bacterium]
MGTDDRKIDKSSKIDNRFPPVVNESKIPVRRAAAIVYDPQKHDVPILSAFGEGHIADKMVALARESGVPILPDKNISSVLSKVSIGDEIPEELYEAIAKVLIFVSDVDRKYGEALSMNNEQ